MKVQSVYQSGRFPNIMGWFPTETTDYDHRIRDSRSYGLAFSRRAIILKVVNTAGCLFL